VADAGDIATVRAEIRILQDWLLALDQRLLALEVELEVACRWWSAELPDYLVVAGRAARLLLGVGAALGLGFLAGRFLRVRDDASALLLAAGTAVLLPFLVDRVLPTIGRGLSPRWLRRLPEVPAVAVDAGATTGGPTVGPYRLPDADRPPGWEDLARRRSELLGIVEQARASCGRIAAHLGRVRRAVGAFQAPVRVLARFAVTAWSFLVGVAAARWGLEVEPSHGYILLFFAFPSVVGGRDVRRKLEGTLAEVRYQVTEIRGEIDAVRRGTSAPVVPAADAELEGGPEPGPALERQLK
jgi:hypothetical protein